MLILVSYDIATTSDNGTTRLRRIAKTCLNYGVRVQNSVFECVVDMLQFEKFKNEIDSIIEKDKDSVRYYNLGNNGRNKVIHVGAKQTIDVEDVLIL
jgi:CRISPR-associated protein Cas2